ncbi:alpha-amylase family glycosyl hydrolase [Ruminococcus gauvreauii]|uniref:Alpha-amylase family glycosyl hydrolase n=1 Tax=Ruminococcus gauvreauii TaxID=438033 RepID=A0ABY5VNE9_9FIRM|nr:alpha-amylase family glycosyl hydrolase [Ruminococcus gauvreauii]UWP61235.1 alpha-amylase family glycosyl hydrolase [Ruminococcus gauvreauii]
MGKWYEEAVFYHMYPIGMTGAPRENTQEGVVHRFEQLHPWLEHVHHLGCTAIYIGPLFESTSHGYDTRDYKLVDRRLGDNEDFRAFVGDAHRRGIKVVVDGVFNHTGREFFAFQDIQKNRENSPYCSWYKGIWFGGNNPYNDGFSYEAWRNCFELVNLNLQEEAVREYLLEVIRFWITEFDIDGIRLDCADCLDFYFMEEMRRRTSEWKEDFWLMGEVIHGDYSRYIGGGENMLHSVTNYELHKGLYSGHNDHNYFEIAHTIRREFDANGGIYRGLKLYSFVDNHDVDRIASKLQVFSHCFPVYTLLYMLPGIPSVYYGSEWGISGRKEGPNDDYLRPAVDLQEVLDDNPHPELMEWIVKLGEIRGTHPVSVYGEYRELFLTNRQFAFARTTEEEAVVVAVNNDEVPAEIQVPAPLPEKAYINAVSGEICPVENGRLAVRLEESGAVILYTSAREGE